MRYAILTVTPPPGNTALRCFEEVSATLADGLMQLGHSVIETQDVIPHHRHIVLCPNALFAMRLELPPDTVLYNLEQLVPGAPWYTHDYFNLLGRYEVWDYSPHNAGVLAENAGITARPCPLGYSPALERCIDTSKDIDVILFGLPMPRRVVPFSRLLAHGLNVRLCYGVWGAERDEMLARAKIVLNMHCIEFGLFEAVRCSYYLANGCFVISERGISNSDEEPFASGLHFCPDEDIVGACLQYLDQPLERIAIAKQGQTLMRGRPIAAFLAPLVGVASEPGHEVVSPVEYSGAL